MSCVLFSPPRHRPGSRVLGVLLIAVLCQACSSLERLPGLPGLPNSGSDDILSLPPAEEPPPEGPAAVPLEDGADWIQLKSGEWLRGTLLRIRDGRLVFDSDELGERSFDVDKVVQIRTAAPQVVVTPDSTALHGKLVLDGERAWVEGEQTVQIDREQLFATLHFDGLKPVDWTGELTLGATLRSGNTSQNDFSAFAEAVRETARTRWSSTYNGAISEAQGIETNNNHRLRTNFDVSVTRRLFVTVPRVELYTDRFQNLDYRLTASLPVGYEVLDTDRHDWRISLGPAYQLTRLDTVLPGQDPRDGTFAVTVSSQYAWDMTDTVDLEFDYAITAPLPDSEEYNHNLVLRLSVDLVANLQLDVAFVWDRVNEPVADGDGLLPEPDDYRTTIGLGWSF